MVEDGSYSINIESPYLMAAVCDGVGGYPCGYAAARAATETSYQWNIKATYGIVKTKASANFSQTPLYYLDLLSSIFSASSFKNTQRFIFCSSSCSKLLFWAKSS